MTITTLAYIYMRNGLLEKTVILGDDSDYGSPKINQVANAYSGEDDSLDALWI
jgi:hypothetical protein